MTVSELNLPAGGGLRDRTAAAPGRGYWVVALFLFAMLLPVYINLGTYRLSGYRIVLLVAFIPLVVGWLTGKCGRIHFIDIALILYCIWAAIALFVNQGSSQIEFVGIFFVENISPYLLARRYIRSSDDLTRVAKTLFWILMILWPAAAYESLTGTRIYSELAAPLGTVIPQGSTEIRFGLIRAQSVFAHAILFGIFAASALPLLYYSRRKGGTKRAGLRRAWVSPAAAFFSLSSAGYLGVALSIGFIVWNWILGRLSWRWWLLLGLFGAAILVLEIATNRGALSIIATSLALNTGTAYYRMAIIEFGLQNVWANPILGLGMGDWVRPSWMLTASVDNFWLLTAMRYGIPGFILFLGIYACAITQCLRVKVSRQEDKDMRLGLLLSLVSMAVVIFTVHIWDTVYVYVLFLLGATFFLRDSNERTPGDTAKEEPDETALPADTQPVSRYSRFPAKPGNTNAAVNRTTARTS